MVFSDEKQQMETQKVDVNQVFEEALNRAKQDLETKVAREIVIGLAHQSENFFDLVIAVGSDPRLQKALQLMPFRDLFPAYRGGARLVTERKPVERKPAKVRPEVLSRVLEALSKGPLSMVELVSRCGGDGESKVRAALAGAKREGKVKMLGDRRSARYELLIPRGE